MTRLKVSYPLGLHRPRNPFRSQDLLDEVARVSQGVIISVERILGVKTSIGTKCGVSLDELTLVPQIFPAREAGGRGSECYLIT